MPTEYEVWVDGLALHKKLQEGGDIFCDIFLPWLKFVIKHMVFNLIEKCKNMLWFSIDYINSLYPWFPTPYREPFVGVSKYIIWNVEPYMVHLKYPTRHCENTAQYSKRR